MGKHSFWVPAPQARSMGESSRAAGGLGRWLDFGQWARQLRWLRLAVQDWAERFWQARTAIFCLMRGWHASMRSQDQHVICTTDAFWGLGITGQHYHMPALAACRRWHAAPRTILLEKA